MNGSINRINTFLYEEFIFSSKYKVWRHITYWSFHILAWSIFWIIMGAPVSIWRNLFNMSLWVPVFIFFGYPLAYIAVPQLLLKGRLWQFFLLIIAWGGVGIFLNSWFRTLIYIPIQQAMGFEVIPESGFQAHSYLCMTTSAASPIMIRFFKLWKRKQEEWIQVQQEKITAELHLLKAQLHPHFLFNTLNNIYSFALENSSKTPQLIMKLSSLLKYILHECSSDVVPLEKELEVMKNYIDLEKERYGEKIDIVISIEGDTAGKYISPLLMLPFLENAFKHGTSEQLEKPWLSVDIIVKGQMLKFKIVNSKNEFVPVRKNGVGINNVKSRLQLLYPGKHTLELADKGDLFVASLLLQLPAVSAPVKSIFTNRQPEKIVHETTLFAN